MGRPEWPRGCSRNDLEGAPAWQNGHGRSRPRWMLRSWLCHERPSPAAEIAGWPYWAVRSEDVSRRAWARSHTRPSWALTSPASPGTPDHHTAATAQDEPLAKTAPCPRKWTPRHVSLPARDECKASESSRLTPFPVQSLTMQRCASALSGDLIARKAQTAAAWKACRFRTQWSVAARLEKDSMDADALLNYRQSDNPNHARDVSTR
jgi:hypothetical protein